MRSRGGALMNGISAFIRITESLFPLSFRHVRTRGEVGCLQPRRELTPEPNQTDTMVTGLWLPEP